MSRALPRNRALSGRRVLLTACLISLFFVHASAQRPSADVEVELAVIIHPKNTVTNLQLPELRAALRLEKQFWSGGRRIALFLPTSRTAEKKILLQKIYGMTDKELRRYWLGKVFAGDIPSAPSVVRSARDAGEVVKKTSGAMAVVRASDVPKGVQVLAINGKKPGDKDYPLTGTVPESPSKD